jgi:hypothetical protein
MKKELIVGKVTISYDIEKLSKEIDNLQWDKPYFVEQIEEILESDPDADEFPDNGNEFEVASQEDFDELKKSFKEDVLEILNNPESIDISSYLIKSGLFHKSKNKVLVWSSIYSNYSDEYGSHSYDEIILEIQSDYNDPSKGEIQIRSISQQSSF